MRLRARAMIAIGLASAGALGTFGGSAAATTSPTTPNPCGAAASPGGEWPSYGHDAANTRTQDLEHTLGTAQASALAPAWVFRLSAQGDAGNFESTPVVSGGCSFVASSAGTVYAVSTATGAVVWKAAFATTAVGLGGAIVGGLAIDHGRALVAINQAGDGKVGPYLVALDTATGNVAWKSAPLSTLTGYYTNATPQVFGTIAFIGYSPPEGQSDGQGGFVLLDSRTGTLLRNTPTVPPADQAKGFAGGGIWSTPAFDSRSGFAYIGAGNPFSKTQEDPHTNAILKVDLRRASATFGQVVAAYKGNVDQYTQALQAGSQTPVCTLSQAAPDPLDDPACGQLDLDFGAAPNLFTVAGRLRVGDLQKSGVYHVADATTMAPAWSTVVGGTCQACNAASTAFSGGAVLGVSTPGGAAYSLDGASGAQRWLTPLGDGVHYQATSVANGVAYTFDTTGFFDVLDAATGIPLTRRPMAADAGAPAAALTSGGIAVAEHTIFVAASEEGNGAGTTENGFLIAYR